MPGVEPELQYLQAMASESSPLLDLARQAWRELQPLQAAQAAGSDPVAARLLELRPLAAADADPAALQRLRGWLDDYYTAGSVAASALRAGRPPGAELEQASAKLQAVAGTLPLPIGPIVRGLADDAMTNLRGAGGAIAQGQAARMHARIVDAFQEQVAQPCARTLGNRFPLRRDGADADLEDFRAFFAPGGAADSYFRSYLQPWVDTSRRPWRYRSAAAPETPGAPEASDGAASSGASSPATGPVVRELLDLLRRRGPDPEAFARLAQVRGALWRNGAGPQWDFDLTVPELDTRWAMLHLDIDGLSMRYAHGPVLAWHASWPSRHPGSGHVRMRLEGLEAGDAHEYGAQGAWAWMHLLAQGRRLGAAPGGGLDLAYGAKGRRAVLHLAGPEPNPWKAGLLEGLQCPR
jgi:type VI secretion system protein ImpL